jgi:hypothetical protein
MLSRFDRRQKKRPVGASLLAKAVCQATSILADMTFSRAGQIVALSLPQGFAVLLI